MGGVPRRRVDTDESVSSETLLSVRRSAHPSPGGRSTRVLPTTRTPTTLGVNGSREVIGKGKNGLSLGLFAVS